MKRNKLYAKGVKCQFEAIDIVITASENAETGSILAQ